MIEERIFVKKTGEGRVEQWLGQLEGQTERRMMYMSPRY